MPETVIPQPLISPVPPTIPVTPVINQPISHGKPFRPLITLTAILLVSSLAFGAYQLGKIQSPPPTSEPQIISPAVSTISLTPSDSANPVANWKTFTNASYKYQLQYPPDWKITADGSIIYEGSDSDIPVPYKYGRVILSKEDNPKRFTDITKWWEDKYHPNGSNEGLLGKSTPEAQGTTVNANKVVILKARPFTIDGDLRYYVLSPNSTVVTLTFSTSTPEKISDQILATFKFLGQPETTLPVCGDERFGFSIGDVYECGDFNILLPGAFIMDAPVTITDKNWKEITQCGGMPGPNGNNSCPEKYSSTDGCKRTICPTKN